MSFLRGVFPGVEWLNFSLPFSWVILYSSAICFAVGVTVYLLRCPVLVQRFDNFSEFESSGETFERLVSYAGDLESKSEGYSEIALRLEELSSETGPDDIDGNNVAVIELSKFGRTYNVRKIHFRESFWILYDGLDKSRSVSFVFSAIFFLLGFFQLAFIFFQNLIYVASIIFHG